MIARIACAWLAGRALIALLCVLAIGGGCPAVETKGSKDLTPEQVAALIKPFNDLYEGKDAASRLKALEALAAIKMAPDMRRDIYRQVAIGDSDRAVAMDAWERWCKDVGPDDNFRIVRVLRDWPWIRHEKLQGDPSVIFERLEIAERIFRMKMSTHSLLVRFICTLPYPGTGIPDVVKKDGRMKEYLQQCTLSDSETIALQKRAVELLNRALGLEIQPGPKAAFDTYAWNLDFGKRIVAEDQENAYGNNRFKALSDKYDNRDDRAEVMVASCIGGEGTEWLSGGDFQPDGTIVLGGTSLGPVLEIRGRHAQVLGSDSGTPEVPKFEVERDGGGKPILDPIGREKRKPLVWMHPNGAAFLVRMNAELTEVRSLHRFPWKAGGCSSLVCDRDGFIYVTGWAGDGIAALSTDVQEWPAGDQGKEQGNCARTYIAKLAPDCSRVLWVRHMKGTSNAPRLRLSQQHDLLFQGPDLRTIGRDGRLKHAIVLPGGVTGNIAVNPLDGTYARGGDRGWATGREPWRCPWLNIYRPDGRVKWELYHQDGPFIGGATGLVSDSSVRGLHFDDHGFLWFIGWSDGGNTVFNYHPYDVKAPHKSPGLGMGSWGVTGATSVAHIFKLDTRTWKVAAAATWCAYLATTNSVNGLKINDIRVGDDGSVLVSGASAWGLIQTGNSIGGGEPGGKYIAVFNPSLTSVRFSSAIPAAGSVVLSDADQMGIADWFQVAVGTHQGRPVAMFLSGAVKDENVYGRIRPPPEISGLEGGFGGGLTDGHVVLVDLQPDQKKKAGEPPTVTEAPTAKPADPAAKPPAPATRPADPTATPIPPATKPDDPVAKPAPTAKPTDPTTKPATPVAKPGEPIAAVPPADGTTPPAGTRPRKRGLLDDEPGEGEKP